MNSLRPSLLVASGLFLGACSGAHKPSELPSVDLQDSETSVDHLSLKDCTPVAPEDAYEKAFLVAANEIIPIRARISYILDDITQEGIPMSDGGMQRNATRDEVGEYMDLRFRGLGNSFETCFLPISGPIAYRAHVEVVCAEEKNKFYWIFHNTMKGGEAYYDSGLISLSLESAKRDYYCSHSLTPNYDAQYADGYSAGMKVGSAYQYLEKTFKNHGISEWSTKNSYVENCTTSYQPLMKCIIGQNPTRNSENPCPTRPTQWQYSSHSVPRTPDQVNAEVGFATILSQCVDSLLEGQ